MNMGASSASSPFLDRQHRHDVVGAHEPPVAERHHPDVGRPYDFLVAHSHIVANMRSPSARQSVLGLTACGLLWTTERSEPEFAVDLGAALSAAGFDVELREPLPQARYDTSIHLVVEGVAIRVSERPGRPQISRIAATVRQVEARRRNERGRYWAVPIYEGETSRVLEWVDIFG